MGPPEDVPPSDQQASPCLPSLPVFTNHPGPETISNDMQAIFTSLEIQCNGHITAWKAYTKGTQAGTIYFQVWRRVAIDATHYILVGEDILVNARPVNNIVTMDVDESDGFIHVIVGDVIGLYQHASADHESFKVRTKRDQQQSDVALQDSCCSSTRD